MMIRTLCGALVLVLAGPIAGCGDDGKAEATNASEESTSSPLTTTGDPPTSSTGPDTPTTGDDTTGIVDPSTTSETSGTTDAESSTTSDDTTGGVEAECDPKAQDCPPGSKCTAYGKLPGDEWNANKCIPEVQDGGVGGDDCTVEGPDKFSGIDDCAKGFICLNTDDQGKNGFCVEFCSPTDECPNTSGGAGICLPDTNDGYLPICLFQCDPLLQDCPGEQGCYGDVSMPFFICFNPDPQGNQGVDGDDCAFTNACVGGFHCAAAGTLDGCDAMMCCTPFCPLDGMECADPEVCTPFFPDPTPGFENVGLCTLPP